MSYKKRVLLEFTCRCIISCIRRHSEFSCQSCTQAFIDPLPLPQSFLESLTRQPPSHNHFIDYIAAFYLYCCISRAISMTFNQLTPMCAAKHIAIDLLDTCECAACSSSSSVRPTLHRFAHRAVSGEKNIVIFFYKIKIQFPKRINVDRWSRLSTLRNIV